MPITPADPFKWRHFPGEVILLCVRRSAPYFGLSDASQFNSRPGHVLQVVPKWR
jgi:hypothetical protein